MDNGENKVVYSNQVAMMMSNMELRILFNLESPQIEGNQIGSIKNECVADVRLNPLMAEQLYKMLGDHIEAHKNIVADTVG